MIREEYEHLEERLLSPLACLSKNSVGRAIPEKKDPYRTDFQRDVDRIIYSKAFRRLQYKTQVFIAPKGDHYRNRLTHTLEVMAIARSISRALRLNPDLTEAIAVGHDLGHSPFGHAGEEVLNEKVKEYFEDMQFVHTEQSLRVVDLLEKRLKSDGTEVFGLNLTHEVREGIAKHSKGLKDLKDFSDSALPSTLEGQVVRISDRIAYLHHDLDDAIRAKIIKESDVPEKVKKILGDNNSKRLSTIILNVIEESRNKDKITVSTDIEMAMDEWKNFLMEKVYIGSEPKKEEEKVKIILGFLFDYYMNNIEKLRDYLHSHPIIIHHKDPVSYLKEDKRERVRAIADYISSMTDRFAIELVQSIMFPSPIS
ncbi:deoxyguanosinetriphosphate triphosphohydrolase [Caldisericum exile]|uniref:DNTP triphosphohydrolase n=1 Tax=Caldisericum exile (strain DSM 21853 / NBRC 104410 / AZM16c01) TaxID=511051 RepID=A0A7U6JFX9_CALEA|nr:deoxyguanosinetriphosphate triphosphohydrolase [Caldisericum exile]BAL80959.1 dNTP triphosphohydrolase [Caldisericum exile AZM16c01]